MIFGWFFFVKKLNYICSIIVIIILIIIEKKLSIDTSVVRRNAGLKQQLIIANLVYTHNTFDCLYLLGLDLYLHDKKKE